MGLGCCRVHDKVITDIVKQRQVGSRENAKDYLISRGNPIRWCMRLPYMMRSILPLAMLPALLVSCGSGDLAVGESTRIEIVSPLGHTLDCPDELVAGTVRTLPEEDAGAATALQAAEDHALYLNNKGSFEPAPGSSTAFLLVDRAGQRLAWLSTAEGANGWFVVSVEECGSVPGGVLLTPGGPCIDQPDDYGDSSLFVAAAGIEALAALNFVEAGYCPRTGGGGSGYNADGFLVTLDDTLLTMVPEEPLTISGPGYFAAELTSTWEIIDVQADPVAGQVWTLQAPAEPGSYRVDLRLEWAEGKSHHAILVDVVAAQP